MDTNGESGDRRECDVLCRLVGVAIGGGNPPADEDFPEDLNPARLVQLATRHRCLPLMMAGLDCRLREGRTGGVLLDPETQARVTRLLMIGTGRAVFLARRLVGLLRDFDGAGVRALALKGPALSLELYGRVDFRP